MGNAIISLFEDSGMSIREFAERSGLKYSTAHDIVRGRANIENVGAGAFVRIAKALGTTADALLGVDDAPAVDAGAEELLGIYDNLSPEGKNQLLTFARGCAATYPKNNGLAGAASA